MTSESTIRVVGAQQHFLTLELYSRNAKFTAVRMLNVSMSEHTHLKIQTKSIRQDYQSERMGQCERKETKINHKRVKTRQGNVTEHVDGQGEASESIAPVKKHQDASRKRQDLGDSLDP